LSKVFDVHCGSKLSRVSNAVLLDCVSRLGEIASTMSIAEQYIPIMLEMLKDPPDRNEPLPLANRPSTVYGVTMPFHVSTLDRSASQS
jgi:hypothetical protein